jgi:hypothetical protein
MPSVVDSEVVVASAEVDTSLDASGFWEFRARVGSVVVEDVAE